MKTNNQTITIDATSTADQLRDLANKTHELNRIIARHPSTDAITLDAILNFRDDTDEDQSPELRRLVLQHPNASYRLIAYWARKYPEDLLKNPALGKIIADNDELYLDAPEILSTPGCPNELLNYAANHGDAKHRAYLLLNPELPDSVREIVSGDRTFMEAQERLIQFIAVNDDVRVREYLQAYANTSRPIWIPRFFSFDKTNSAHRRADQVLCGFPYTSAKWVWPVGKNGEYMQPISQIDLSQAGRLLNEDFTAGLLQIWGGVGQGLGVHMTRVIPASDLNDMPDDFYPEHASWLKKESDGDLNFENCTVSSFGIDDFFPFSSERCRVEWVSLGSMFYPSIYKRISHSLEQDDLDGRIKNWKADWSDLEALDETLDDLKLPTALTLGINPLFQLGGYGDGLGNTWRENNGSLLLWHSIDYAVKITIAVYYKRNDEGDMVFSVVSNCDN